MIAYKFKSKSQGKRHINKTIKKIEKTAKEALKNLQKGDTINITYKVEMCYEEV